MVEKLVAKLGVTDPVMRDVSSGIPLVDADWINAAFNKGWFFTLLPATVYTSMQLQFSDATEEQKALPTPAISRQCVEELKAANTIIIGCPMYNFNVSAALKSWIDMICLVGHTFKYEATGPVGLLTGKKVFIVISTGGIPVGSPMDFATPYLKAVFGFIGITDITIIDASKGNVAAAEEAIAAL